MPTDSPIDTDSSARICPAAPAFRPAPAQTALGFRERTWIPLLLLASDVLAFEVALLLGFIARRACAAWSPAIFPPGMYVSLALGFLFLPVGCYVAGLYPGYGLSTVERIRRRADIVSVLFAVLVAWDYVVQHGAWSRGVILASFVFAIVLPPLVSSVTRGILVRRGVWGAPVVVFGARALGRSVLRRLKRHPELGLVPVATFDDRPATWGKVLEGVPVLGPISAAREIDKVGIAILASRGVDRGRIVRAVQYLNFPRVIVLANMPEMPSLWVTPRDLWGNLGLELRRNLLLRRNRLLKRSLDYILGVPLFLGAAPVLALFALWIKRASPGPAFYAQTRVGQGGRTVRIWKLRTMYPDADVQLQAYLNEHPDEREEWERFFKLKRDPRILPGIGKFLRTTSLDELPQLWNVLRGDMSLVGPRPIVEAEKLKYGPTYDLYALVHPGITGLWQISGRNNTTYSERVGFDEYYVRNWSVWLDVYILFRTVTTVLSGDGAY